MSLSFWTSLGSPNIIHSNTMLRLFNGHTFKLHGIIFSLPLDLGEKIVSVKVEVVDTTSDYNLFLGHNWLYAMMFVVSSLFMFLLFPFEGKVVTIDQLEY